MFPVSDVFSGLALAAVVGHGRSVFLGFQGGKSVATAAGSILALSPPAGLTALGLWGATLAATRMVSAASMLAGPVPAQDANKFKIGLIIPLTGPQASTGKQIEAAARLYMAQNGDTVAGKKIELIVKDDAATPDVTKRLAQELVVNEKVNVLGGFNVLVLYLQERYGWRAGVLQMGLDCSIVLVSFFLRDWSLIILSVLGAVVVNQTLATNHRAGRYVAM